MLIPGRQLTPKQRAQVLDRFINRDTFESPWSPYARALMASSPVSDADWINARAFHFDGNGQLERLPCEPMPAVAEVSR